MYRFTFPEAGIGGQPEVRSAVLRFRQLPQAARMGVVSLWGWLLGPNGTPPYKHAQVDVLYTDGPSPVKGQTCGNCVAAYQHVTTGTFICDRVRGPIRPAGWCNRWLKPVEASVYVAYQRR